LQCSPSVPCPFRHMYGPIRSRQMLSRTTHNFAPSIERIAGLAHCESFPRA
jgi:hypothetical protein